MGHETVDAVQATGFGKLCQEWLVNYSKFNTTQTKTIYVTVSYTLQYSVQYSNVWNFGIDESEVQTKFSRVFSQ